MFTAARFKASAPALLALVLAASASAVNVSGTSAGLSWSAATGPLTGYAIQVSRNNGAYVEEARVSGTSTRVSGQIGETVQVRVAAVDNTGRIGAASVPSDAMTFTSAPPPPPAPAGDVDGDGVADALAFNSSTGELSVLLVRSNGTRVWQVIGTPSDSGMRPAGYADVDGDGQGDLLWRNAGLGTNELWLMNGTNYSVVALPSQASSWGVAAFRDFSGDGRADLLFHAASAGSSELWTLTGAGRSGVLAVDPAPASMRLAAVADLDGDGAPDLVGHDLASGALEAWQMNGAVPTAVFSLPNAPVAASIAGVGDFDADGQEDLAWLVSTKKKRSAHVWFMNGMQAPQQGVAVKLKKKSLLRGVVDVNSNGRDDLVFVGKQGFTAYSVAPTGTPDANGEMQWSAQAIPLPEVPSSKLWYFLVLQ